MYSGDRLRLFAEGEEGEDAVEEVWGGRARAVRDREAVVGDVGGFGGRKAAGRCAQREKLGVADELVLFGQVDEARIVL